MNTNNKYNLLKLSRISLLGISIFLASCNKVHGNLNKQRMQNKNDSTPTTHDTVHTINDSMKSNNSLMQSDNDSCLTKFTNSMKSCWTSVYTLIRKIECPKISCNCSWLSCLPCIKPQSSITKNLGFENSPNLNELKDENIKRYVLKRGKGRCRLISGSASMEFEFDVMDDSSSVSSQVRDFKYKIDQTKVGSTVHTIPNLYIIFPKKKKKLPIVAKEYLSFKETYSKACSMENDSSSIVENIEKLNKDIPKQLLNIYNNSEENYSSEKILSPDSSLEDDSSDSSSNFDNFEHIKKIEKDIKEKRKKKYTKYAVNNDIGKLEYKKRSRKTPYSRVTSTLDKKKKLHIHKKNKSRRKIRNIKVENSSDSSTSEIDFIRH